MSGRLVVDGHCPACGRRALRVDASKAMLREGPSVLVCANHDCPRPTAAAEILADSETEHLVTLQATEFTVKHPLRERLDNALMHCQLHAWIAGLDEPPYALGLWRVRWPANRWEPLDV